MPKYKNKKDIKLHAFYTTLKHINDIGYKPTQLIMSSIEEEKPNSEYAAVRFKLSHKSVVKTIRLRAAKQTPTKVGQFVTFW